MHDHRPAGGAAMRRRAASFLLCVLVLGWPALAAGQDVERPPKELWDEFPLEPSATPSPPARPASTLARGVTAQHESGDGMTSRALIALAVAAAGIGAIAARVAARRLPRATRTTKVAATSHPPAVAVSRPTTTAETQPMPEPAPPRPPHPRRRAATGRFAPDEAPQPPRPALTCAIKLTRWPPMGRFVAVAAGGRELARSPMFELKRTEDDTGPTPPEALRTLVEELTAGGWRKTAAGRTPWDLRFEREPQGAVTRRASPPSA